MIKLAVEAVKKSGNMKAFSVVKLHPLHESFCSISHGPIPLYSLFLWLPGSETPSAQPSVCKRKYLQNKTLSIFLWTVNIFSQHCSLVETGMAAGSPTADGIMSKGMSANGALSCGFISQKKGTQPGNSVLTQTKCSLLELYFCSL